MVRRPLVTASLSWSGRRAASGCSIQPCRSARSGSIFPPVGNRGGRGEKLLGGETQALLKAAQVAIEIPVGHVHLNQRMPLLGQTGINHQVVRIPEILNPHPMAVTPNPVLIIEQY